MQSCESGQMFDCCFPVLTCCWCRTDRGEGDIRPVSWRWRSLWVVWSARNQQRAGCRFGSLPTTTPCCWFPHWSDGKSPLFPEQRQRPSLGVCLSCLVNVRQMYPVVLLLPGDVRHLAGQVLQIALQNLQVVFGPVHVGIYRVLSHLNVQMQLLWNKVVKTPRVHCSSVWFVVIVSAGLTSLSPANTENLVVLVWKHRWCWPEAWAVKVNFPNFPKRLDNWTWKGKKNVQTFCNTGQNCRFKSNHSPKNPTWSQVNKVSWYLL